MSNFPPSPFSLFSLRLDAPGNEEWGGKRGEDREGEIATRRLSLSLNLVLAYISVRRSCIAAAAYYRTVLYENADGKRTFRGGGEGGA